MKENDKKNLKAGVWYTISNFISKALIYLCTPIYIRIISTSDYGLFNNFLSWQSIVMTLITLDLSSSVAIAYLDYKDKFKEYITTISICGVIIPAIFGIIMLICHNFFCDLFKINFVHLGIMVLNIACANNLNIYQSQKRVELKYKESSVITILLAAINVILTLSLVYTLEDKILALIIGSCFGNILISIFIFAKTLLNKFTFKISYLKYCLIIAIPLIPHSLAGIILGSSDKIMITEFCGSDQTALYSVVFNISMIIIMFITSINNAWVPWFFQKIKEGDKESIQKVSNEITIILAIVSFFIILLAPEIILIVGGQNYLPAIKCVPIIVMHCFTHYIYTLYVNIEFYSKKTWYISTATIIASLINVGLNFLFIPWLGYFGAAWTTLISSFFMLLLHYFVVNKMNFSKLFDAKTLFASLLIFFVISINSTRLYSFFTLRISVVVLYSICILCLLFFKRNKVKKFIYTLIKK